MKKFLNWGFIIKKLGLQLCFLLFLIIFLPTASAVLLGVNKVEIEYKDMLRGGFAEDSVVISTGSIENISVYANATGDIADWITIIPATQPLIMSANSPAEIKIIVEPPTDVAVGTYEGKLLLSTGPLAKQESNMGTIIEVGFEVKIKIIITDTQILSCTSGGFEIQDAEVGYPLIFSATSANNGNVRIKPTFEVKVYDQNQQKLIETLSYISSEDILPTISSRIDAQLNHSLKEGQYWAEVSSPNCLSGSLLTFSILEKGGISDVGEFVRLENEAWAKTGEIVAINAQFRNRGTRIVSAQFKGIITNSDNKIVKVISSDKLDVASGELINLEMFYTPEDVGQYKISGRVHYNNKITYEKSSMLNVEQGIGTGSYFALEYLVLGGILIVIIVLMSLIIIKKRKKNKVN